MFRKIIAGLALFVLVATAGGVAFGQATQNHALPGNIRIASGTATATAGAATLANKAGKITSEALTTATAAVYTLTITNTAVAAADLCFASVANGTNTQGATVVQRVTPAANSLVILVKNVHASEALNGTIVISYLCVRP